MNIYYVISVELELKNKVLFDRFQKQTIPGN